MSSRVRFKVKLKTERGNLSVDLNSDHEAVYFRLSFCGSFESCAINSPLLHTEDMYNMHKDLNMYAEIHIHPEARVCFSSI